MLKEYGRAKMKASGLYGSIADWRPGEDHCEFEPDWWQDDDSMITITCDIADLEELVEVGKDERREVLANFDVLVISAYSELNLLGWPTVVIRRSDDGIDVIVQNYTRAIDEEKTLDVSEASAILSAVFATRADEWIEPLEPDFAVLDGYSWLMTVYSGNRYFTCNGDNVVPCVLVDLLYAIAGAGLPLAWNGEEMLFPHDVLKGTLGPEYMWRR